VRGDWQQLVTRAATGAIAKIRLFLTAPSWMCQFCSAAIQKFSQHLNSLGQELTDFVEVFLVSLTALCSKPLAKDRGSCGYNALDYRDLDFARNWELLVQEWGY